MRSPNRMKLAATMKAGVDERLAEAV